MDPMRFLTLAHQIFRVAHEICDNSDEIVAIVGEKNSGKSTLINCLIGNPLKVKTIRTKKASYLEHVDKNCKPEIGPLREDDLTDQPGTTFGIPWPKLNFPWLNWLYKAQEETNESNVEADTNVEPPMEYENYVPSQFGTIPGTAWPIWEIHWLGEGFEQEVSNIYNFYNILKQAKRIRVILVMPYNILAGENPMIVFNNLNNLRKISSDINQSLIIVASKAKKEDIKNVVEKLSKVKIKNLTDKDLIAVTEGQAILKHVLLNKNYCNFMAPNGRDDEIYVMKDKATLLTALKKISAIKVANSIAFSDYAQDFFEDFHQVIISAFESYADTYVQEIKEYGKNEIEKRNSNISNLFQLREFFETILKMSISEKITELNKIISGVKELLHFLRVVEIVEQILKDRNIDLAHCSNLFEVKLNEMLIEIMLELSSNLNETVEEKRSELEKIRNKKNDMIEENKKVFGEKVWECACDKKIYIDDILISAAIVPWREFNPLVKDLLILQNLLQHIRWK